MGIFILVALGLVIGCNVQNNSSLPLDAVEEFPREPASQQFWEHWSDNRAELSAYKLTTPRYGELRQGVSVLIYVIEEMDTRTWIKDDQGDVPEEHRTVVMKLNHLSRFQTGIYPYSVMTSVFSPVGGIGRERFAPTRITHTVQEWCGHIYHKIMPKAGSYVSEMRSYFSVEGETSQEVETERYALYEDALLIQLRELDGSFAHGTNWSGQIIPSLWSQRLNHKQFLPVHATITRSSIENDDGKSIIQFVLRYGDFERTYSVEAEKPHRILGWSTSTGEVAILQATERLSYWQLNNEGDQYLRERFGLHPNHPTVVEGTP